MDVKPRFSFAVLLALTAVTGLSALTASLLFGCTTVEPVERDAASADILRGLRSFYAATARPDGSFAPGVDPDYRGVAESSRTDLAPIAFAVAVHETFGWQLPHAQATRDLLRARQREDGAFRSLSGTSDPETVEARLYNTAQALVTLRSLGVDPPYDPVRFLEGMRKQDDESLPEGADRWLPLAYLAAGREVPADADRQIRKTFEKLPDGYVDAHVEPTFHAVHYYRLVGGSTPQAEEIVARLLRDQKPDGSWFLHSPSRDVHATFCAVFILEQLGGGAKLCRSAIERAALWSLECRNADGGFGHFPGSPSDADATYFQVATLVVAGVLEPEVPEDLDPRLIGRGHLIPPPE